MGIRVLDNSMFDVGTIECKNFCINTLDDSFVCEWDYIKEHFSDKIQDRIRESIGLGRYHVVLEPIPIDGIGYVIEINWD